MSRPADLALPALQEPAFWRQLNPALHIGDQAYAQSVGGFELDAPTCAVFEQRLVEEGYFQFGATPAQWQLPLADMAQAVRSLLPLGLMPPFAFLYDEFWLLYAKQSRILSHFLGGSYWMLPDFWVWHVDPAKGQAGWRPHRDKGRSALFDDGRAKSLTVWIPLTEATPMNGCMYMVPANRDRHYNTAQEDDWQFDYPDIRALPGQPGDVFYWNQAVLHWGSRTSRFAAQARISVAFEFQRADVPAFNQPLLDPTRIPAFDDRLRLIAKQLLQYNHMYPLAPQLEAFARQILQHG